MSRSSGICSLYLLETENHVCQVGEKKGQKATTVVGNFNPFGKYPSNWIISPGRGGKFKRNRNQHLGKWPINKDQQSHPISPRTDMEPFYQRLQENKGPPAHYGLILQKRCCESNSTCSSCTIVKGRHPSCFFVMKKISQTEYRTSQIPQLVSNKKQPDVYPTEAWKTCCFMTNFMCLF